MGGAVSSGRDNNELIDNLMGGNYIRTRAVERVFRVLDRADYMTPEARYQAYKDLAWRNGPLHMSAPCIYSEVMEGLELHPGLSFLNIGSGTGYLSTLVGLILGSGGISHGVEVNSFVVEYANKKLSLFLDTSPTLDEFDFCEPKFYCGNGLCLAPLQSPYDRVYCGAACPEEYQNYFKQLIKVGGILVMPLNDNLVQVRRVGQTEWVSRSLLNVSFATLQVPTKDEATEFIKLEEQTPARLQALARGAVRRGVRAGLLRRHPDLREPPRRQPSAKPPCPRRICIAPVDDDSDVEGLNALHDLDPEGGAHEMNALLSLVLSMGQNRVAGALRFDALDSPADSPSEDDERDPGDGSGGDDDDDDPGDGSGGGSPRTGSSLPHSTQGSSPPADDESGASKEGGEREAGRSSARSRRGVLTFELRDTYVDTDQAPAPAPAPTDTSAPAASSAPATSDASAASAPSTSTHTRVAPSESKDSESKSGPAHDSDDDGYSLVVPTEVEFFLDKPGEAEAPRPAAGMDWERPPDDSSDDDTIEDDTDTNTNTREEKRQKLDSGIGEETTPTSDSSPIKSDSKTDESDADGSRPSDSLTDDVDDRPEGRRRLRKRSRAADARSSSASRSPAGRGGAGGRRRCKRRAADAGDAGNAEDAGEGGGAPDARRLRLSLLMKRGVGELPLPHPLKKFVNLGRYFDI